MKRRSDERIIKEIERIEKLRLRYGAEGKYLHSRVMNSYKHILQWTLGNGPDDRLEKEELWLLLPEEKESASS